MNGLASSLPHFYAKYSFVSFKSTCSLVPSPPIWLYPTNASSSCQKFFISIRLSSMREENETGDELWQSNSCSSVNEQSQNLEASRRESRTIMLQNIARSVNGRENKKMEQE